jgi:L-seryl-tRNA(Ser) seleniumtransferase
LRAAVPDVRCGIEDGTSEVGGGALPLQILPTRLLAIGPGREGASALEARLRTEEPSVLVRVQDERVLIDLRTVAPEDEAGLLAALTSALTETRSGEDA